MYLYILKDREFFVEEYDRLLLSQSVIFLLSYHGASVYLHILKDWKFFCWRVWQTFIIATCDFFTVISWCLCVSAYLGGQGVFLLKSMIDSYCRNLWFFYCRIMALLCICFLSLGYVVFRLCQINLPFEAYLFELPYSPAITFQRGCMYITFLYQNVLCSTKYKGRGKKPHRLLFPTFCMGEEFFQL